MPYPDDSALRTQVLDLYGSTFPQLPEGIARARTYGSEWFEASTPFVARHAGRVIAHVGVVAVDLWIHGAARRPAAVHAVCVHPDHRGRGLGRQVMQEALAFVDAQGFDSCILWSDLVDLYARFGFQPCKESVFIGAAPDTTGSPGRLLDLEAETDLARLRRLVAGRTPVSELAAAADDGWHLLIDLGLWDAARSNLWYLEDVDALVVGERKGAELHLYDIVAASLPTFERVVAAVPGSSERVVCYLTPDLLAPRLQPAVRPLEDFLMVRGAPLFDPAVSAFGLSPLVQT